MCVLIFFTNFVWNISYSKKNRERYDHICMFVFKQSTCYSCPILMELKFLVHIFEKSQRPNFTKIRPVSAELFHANGKKVGRFSPFSGRA